jgi:hypothetical protein
VICSGTLLNLANYAATSIRTITNLNSAEYNQKLIGQGMICYEYYYYDIFFSGIIDSSTVVMDISVFASKYPLIFKSVEGYTRSTLFQNILWTCAGLCMICPYYFLNHSYFLVQKNKNKDECLVKAFELGFDSLLIKNLQMMTPPHSETGESKQKSKKLIKVLPFICRGLVLLLELLSGGSPDQRFVLFIHFFVI